MFFFVADDNDDDNNVDHSTFSSDKLCLNKLLAIVRRDRKVSEIAIAVNLQC